MRRTHIIPAFIALILCATLQSPAIAQETFSVTSSDKYDIGKNAQATIQGNFGPIMIKGVDGTTASVVVTKSATAREMKTSRKLAKEVQVEIKGSQGRLSIKSSGPSDSRKFGKYGYEISITITVPKGTNLDVKNKFGSISIRNVYGKMNLNGRHGSIEVKSAHSVSVSNAFGSVYVAGLSGNATIDNKHGSVRCYRAKSCNITNEFGSVEVEDVKGFVDIQGQAGSIDASGVRNGKFHNSVGSTYIKLAESFKGTLDIKVRGGSIKTNIDLISKKESRNSSQNRDTILKGSIGKGSDSITVYAESGTITVNR